MTFPFRLCRCRFIHVYNTPEMPALEKTEHYSKLSKINKEAAGFAKPISSTIFMIVTSLYECFP